MSQEGRMKNRTAQLIFANVTFQQSTIGIIKMMVFTKLALYIIPWYVFGGSVKNGRVNYFHLLTIAKE